MLDALRLVARVEQESAVLRGLGLTPGVPRIDGAWGVRPGGRGEHLVVPPVPPSAPSPPDDRVSEIGADAIFLGRPSSGLLRVRAFYVAAGLTMAVHGREPLTRQSRLLAGASVLQGLRLDGQVVVPGVAERGRRLRHSWVVEELLPGRRFLPAEWSSAVPELAAALSSVWLSGSLGTVAMHRVLTASVIRSIGGLTAGEPAASPVARDLAMRLGALAASGARLLVGRCHGDPVHGNWLRLPDGRAALLDWELARRRPLGHDAMKIVVGHADPLRVVDAAAPASDELHAAGTAPWRSQVAASLAAWLATRPQDRAIAERTSGMAAYRRRVIQRLELLEAITA